MQCSHYYGLSDYVHLYRSGVVNVSAVRKIFMDPHDPISKSYMVPYPMPMW